MKIELNLVTIGHWALIVGIILAIVAGLTTIPAVTIILLILGLIIGFLNIKEKEGTSFLVAVIALLVIGVAGLQLGVKLSKILVPILENVIGLVAAAGLVVALKQVIVLAKPNVE